MNFEIPEIDLILEFLVRIINEKRGKREIGKMIM